MREILAGIIIWFIILMLFWKVEPNFCVNGNCNTYSLTFSKETDSK